MDLVCHLPPLKSVPDARAVKALIGDRLKKRMADTKKCLKKSGDAGALTMLTSFIWTSLHPISNPHCQQGGELVPDKELKEWKPTNPKGYINRFDQYAALWPRFHLMEKSVVDARGDIAPLPEQTMSKPILKRIVQLLKRHRDKRFIKRRSRSLIKSRTRLNHYHHPFWVGLCEVCRATDLQ